MYGKFAFKLILTMVIAAGVLFPQNYQITRFTNDDGLYSNLIKSIFVDDSGFLWVSTDGGVLRYNGINFRGVQYQFCKQVTSDKQGNIIFAYDMGIIKLEVENHNIKESRLVFGNNTELPNSVHYPKSVFVDSKKRIWIGEYNHLAKWENGKFKKYKTFLSNSSWERSFFCFEEDGVIYALSHNGGFCYYNEKEDRMVQIPSPDLYNKMAISAVCKVDSMYYLGTVDGMFTMKFDKVTKVMKVNRLFTGYNISQIEYDGANRLYMSTWNAGLFTVNLSDISIKSIGLEKSVINNLFYDRFRQSLWVGTNNGLFLLNLQVFQSFVPGAYFPSVTNPYTSFMHRMLPSGLMTTNQKEIIKISKDNSGYFTPLLFKQWKQEDLACFSYYNDKVYAIYKNGFMEVLDASGNVTGTLAVTDSIRVARLTAHDDGNFWGIIENRPLIFKFNEKLEQVNYDLYSKNIEMIQFIKMMNDRKVYLGGRGVNAFIFSYDSHYDQFENLSARLKIKHDLSVNDAAVDSEGKIYLATDRSVYIMRRESDELDTLKVIEDYMNIGCKAIAIDKQDRIWIGTEKGLFCVQDKDYAFFSISDGFVHPSVTFQGLEIDEENNLWVGTAEGVTVRYAAVGDLKRTIRPFLQIIPSLKGEDFDVNAEAKYKSGTNIKFRFSSLQYPVNKIIYKIRMLGLDSNWTYHSDTKEVFYSNLSPGKYTIEIKAKKMGYLWSDVESYSFEIYSPFLLSKIMIILYLMVSIVIIFYLALYYHRYQHKKNGNGIPARE